MELPNAQQRKEYIDSVKELEDIIKHATKDNEISDTTIYVAQKQLDELAQKYQDNEKIGSARYKLYELQALIYHLEQRNSEALDFINQAIETKGDTYPKAEKFKESLNNILKNKSSIKQDESTMTKSEKRKNLIGLEGWLALFVVSQIFSLIVTIYKFFSDGLVSSSDINAINQYQHGLGDSLSSLVNFENIAIFIYVILIITTLVLLFQRRRLAKHFIIATLIFSAVYGLIDYTTASSMFNSSDIFQTTEIQSMMSEYSGNVGKSIISALIWIPYFLISKRVKVTLIK